VTVTMDRAVAGRSAECDSIARGIVLGVALASDSWASIAAADVVAADVGQHVVDLGAEQGSAIVRQPQPAVRKMMPPTSAQ